MPKFIVLYQASMKDIDEWMKKPEAERKGEEAKMKAEWDAWLAAHANLIKETNATGKTKLVTKSGVTDSRNDIMLYSIVEADSQDAVAEVFKTHPHFSIPNASISIMPIRPI